MGTEKTRHLSNVVRSQSRETAERTVFGKQYPLKYFYYISKAKVEMLLPQLRIKDMQEESSEPLVTKALRLIEKLDHENLVVALEDTNDIAASKFYASKAVWRTGLFYFGTMVSITVTYFLWRKHGNAIIVLVGSPDNIIGGRVATQGVNIPSTSDAIDSFGSMEILEAIDIDEVSSVVVGGGRTGSRIPPATKRVSLPARNLLRSDSWLRNMIYTHSRMIGLAIFCLDYLSDLPEMNIDTVFRVYSKSTSGRGSFFNDLKAEYKKGRQEYPTLYTDAGLKEARRLGLEKLRVMYIGSPVYTAIG
jgi:hypothetical protein